MWHSLSHAFVSHFALRNTSENKKKAEYNLFCLLHAQNTMQGNSKAVSCKSKAGRSQFSMSSSGECSIHSVHHDANVLVGQPCTTLCINAALPIIYTFHNVLIMCFFLYFSFHTFYFHFTAFPFPLHPRGRSGGNSVPLLMGFRKHACEQQCKSEALMLWPLDSWRRLSWGVKVDQGGEVDNEGLTGLLDCSMSLRSHIFRRRSRSFSSCSLVLRSLSSFLSLSSVASISHLQYSNTTMSTIHQTSSSISTC